ncbi:MAG: NlpC/P60 family protein [Pseudomonadota bacterium]
MKSGDQVIPITARLNLYDRPHVDDGSVARQVLAGDLLEVVDLPADETGAGADLWVEICAAKDGYKGFVEKAHLRAATAKPTDVIAIREAPVTPQPGVKFGPALRVLFLGTPVEVIRRSDDRRWAEVQLEASSPLGWVFADHLRPITSPVTDPVSVARTFLGSPYVWGGNSGRGIDCSGLVQAALLACDKACPGDSGPQHDEFVEPEREGPFEAGELLFWRGHVAMATGPEKMIHATAHTMSVIEEPIVPALERIAQQGDAPWRGRGRPFR